MDMENGLTPEQRSIMDQHLSALRERYGVFMSEVDIAEYAKISRQHAHNLCVNGAIASFPLTVDGSMKVVRVTVEDLASYLASRYLPAKTHSRRVA